jgi:hypothetical protein
MENSPVPTGLPLSRRTVPMALAALAPLRIRRDWPGAMSPPLAAGLPIAGRQRSPAMAAARDADVARRFETLIAATLLRSARAADLGDDGLGATAEPIRDMIDNSRAEAIARAAPLGVARLLQQQHATATPP